MPFSQFKVSELHFFLYFRHKNFVLTPSWSLSFGIMFATLSLGCVNNAMIICKESEVMSQSVMNFCSS